MESSSTLLSNMKRYIISLLLGVVIGIATLTAYDHYWNMALRFELNEARISDLWAESIRQQPSPAYIIAGDSSARVGIDPQILLDEFHIPCINASQNAGFGLAIGLELAMPYTQKGDTLLLCFQNRLLCWPLGPTPSAGLKFLYKRQGLSFLWKKHYFPLQREEIGQALLGDSAAQAPLITKYLLKMEARSNRFDLMTTHPSGWREVPEACFRTSYTTNSPVALHNHLDEWKLHDEPRALLKELQKDCAQKEVKLIAMIPLQLAPQELRAHSAWLALAYMQMGIPVIKDERLGIVNTLSETADSPEHVRPAVAKEWTKELGHGLKEQIFWTEAELLDRLKALGWDKQGERLHAKKALAE